MVRREEHRRWWSDPANVPIIVRSICSSWSSDKYYTQNHIIRMRQAEMHRMTGSASWYAESFTSDSDTDIFHRYLNRNIKNGGELENKSRTLSNPDVGITKTPCYAAKTEREYVISRWSLSVAFGLSYMLDMVASTVEGVRFDRPEIWKASLEAVPKYSISRLQRQGVTGQS